MIDFLMDIHAGQSLNSEITRWIYNSNSITAWIKRIPVWSNLYGRCHTRKGFWRYTRKFYWILLKDAIYYEDHGRWPLEFYSVGKALELALTLFSEIRLLPMTEEKGSGIRLLVRIKWSCYQQLRFSTISQHSQIYVMLFFYIKLSRLSLFCIRSFK